MIKPQKIAWEQQYSDNSGVEFAVRYDSTKTVVGDSIQKGIIEIESIQKIEFPINMLDWLLSCLNRIKMERTINED